MNLNKIKDILQAEVLTRNSDMDIDVDRGCSSDLISDILAFSTPGAVLLTGLTTGALIRTAEVVDLKAIVFVRGKKPAGETVTLAEGKKIPLLATNLPMFEACGRLYEKGLRGSSET